MSLDICPRMRKKAAFSPLHFSLDYRNGSLLVLGAALLPCHPTFSLSLSQASDVKDLPRGLLLGLMLYSFCNESEEPELQES